MEMDRERGLVGQEHKAKISSGILNSCLILSATYILKSVKTCYSLVHCSCKLCICKILSANDSTVGSLSCLKKTATEKLRHVLPALISLDAEHLNNQPLPSLPFLVRHTYDTKWI